MDAVLILEHLAQLIEAGVPDDQPTTETARLVEDLRDTVTAVRESAGLSTEDVDNAEPYVGGEWDKALARCIYGAEGATNLFQA